MKTSYILPAFIICCSIANGQRYQFERPLEKVTATWHKIVLPDDIFSHLNRDLTDLRIIGVPAEGDTIEAPYLLKAIPEDAHFTQHIVPILNRSRKSNGFYYTIVNDKMEALNLLDLSITKDNFDIRTALEGSNDQHEWFKLVDDYRIVGIANNLINYHFTKLSFPASNFHYFRLLLKTTDDPGLEGIRVGSYAKENGSLKNYPHQTSFSFDKKSRTTTINLTLQEAVPVSQISLKVKGAFDYYRPISVEALVDSLTTANGWVYTYHELGSGMISSLENNEVNFTPFTAKRFKLTIVDDNNTPLAFDSIFASGKTYMLVCRFLAPGEYILIYGDKSADAPSYDITNFKTPLADTLVALTPGDEVRLDASGAHLSFMAKHKEILWITIIIIVCLLGWFSIKMLSGKEDEKSIST